MNQNIDAAHTQFVSLALERQLAHNTIFAVEYAGAHGIHLYDIAASNPVGGGQVYLGDPFDGVDLTHPNSQYSGINTRGSNAASHYSALNLRFQSQNLHNTGLSLVTNCTWAHSTDDLNSTFSDSTGGASNGIGNLGYLDPRHPGSTGAVRTTTFVTAWWSLRYGKCLGSRTAEVGNGKQWGDGPW